MDPSYPRQFSSEQELLSWYRAHRWYHGRLARLVAQFLEWQVDDRFAEAGLPVLAKVSYREKSLDSLGANLKKKRYGRFPIDREQIRDLAGIRVVFYFLDDVKYFCDQRTGLFRMWFGDSALKGKMHDGAAPASPENPNRNYDSWHYPLRVDAETEFFRTLNDMDQAFLEGLYCEVQLRTILQDAWAESNHDMRYKLGRSEDTLRNVATERTFHQVSVDLRRIDQQLLDLKRDFTTNVQVRPQRGERRAAKPWKYDDHLTYPKAVTVANVKYGYELLDRGSRDHLRNRLSIAASTTIFNIDVVMENLTGRKRFKQKMWEHLRTTEPQFVVALTYDSMVVRATDWNAKSRTLSVQFASYSDQVVTNHKRAHDKAIPDDPDGRKVRDLATDAHGNLLSFADSPMSNTVGVSCVLRTYEGHWVVGLRSHSVAFDPGAWGCSASGALAWVELGRWDKRDFDGWFKNGIVREVEEELGYSPRPKDVHYLGLAREFGRLGKPQVFFLIDTDIRSEYLLTKFRTYKLFDSEYQNIRPLDLAEARDLVSAVPERVNRVGGGADVGEELRFNLALALDFKNELS
jgi:ppGpp synthetase/RelA/SpoT-type nucleotidyltranferase